MNKNSVEFKRLRNTWYEINRKCYSVDYASYSEYGGKGINVYKNWTLQKFIKWSLEHKWSLQNKFIIRIDENKDFSPENCYYSNKKNIKSHGLAKCNIYHVWIRIKMNCYNINNSEYYRFGKIGIKVHNDWIDNFQNFYDWCIAHGWGKGLFLVRLDKSGDFSPKNCYFDDKREHEHRIKNDKLYDMWTRMKVICYNKNNKEYVAYGGKGIKVCKKWLDSFKIFYEWAIKNGWNNGLLLTRKDFSKNFNPKNCIFSSSSDIARKSHGIIYDNKTITQWSEERGVEISTMARWVKDYGYETAVKMDRQRSSLEFIISEMLIKLGIDFQQEFTLNNIRADFLLPKHNLIIEANGLYWHSDEVIKDKKHHLKRKDIYTNNGYKSLFFYEDEIEEKLSIIESIILNKLGQSTKIYARKCKIKEVDNLISKQFFEDNHLMGNGRGKVIGLYYNNELMTCIQIIQKKEFTDISRFCHKLGYTVTGGLSKLLKYIELQYKPKAIQTFIDKRYGSGEYLKDLGFELKNESLSFSWVKKKKTLHRMKFPGNTGYQNGYFKIWDCGQAKYLKLLN
jgi:very-short-patch-repair endonuclease